MINLFIIYEWDSWPWDLNTDFALRGCFFRGIKLTKNAGVDKYSYSGYGVGFDICIEYYLPDCKVGKNYIIFGAVVSSSVHIDNNGKDILILGKSIAQGLVNSTLEAIINSNSIVN